MHKRTFVKLSSALVTGAMFSPMISFSQKEKLRNWAGNYEYSTTNLDTPETLEQLKALVKKYSKMKALGTRHCFNGIADSTHQLVSSGKFDKVIELDKQAATVTVGAGIKYGQLCPYLESNGFALHNLASLPHISIAGACATATHGSGDKNGNLATAVAALELVTASGDVVQLSRQKDGDKFAGAVVSLGALGFISKVTLNLQPNFAMRQVVYERLPMSELKDHFEEIESAGYSVSLFTDWQSDSINEVWIKSKAEPGAPFNKEAEFFGAIAASKNLHPIAELSAEHCTEQLGIPGPWYERMPHFKMGFTPSSGKELQSEFFVPRRHAVEAIQAIARLGKQVGPHLFISEIRTIAADDLWMSPCYKQDSVAIHFTWKQEWDAVSKLLPIIEKELSPFNVKPHWGKLFSIPNARLKSLYERYGDFIQLAKEYDPTGKFRNDFLSKNIYGS
ncbi:D-arabinono-1,4-lactone oxidase [Foetidibacter luteolus]|uniref:D-arabinono-1,4-lactone oxidase n=1 Tax=Foetidibacter luteolus TaxID=2608880 RepID=UPI00129B99BA|nr:D-arabinono-1,4-lactone oxidase [Foetidibacter luteolus]